LFRWLSAYLRVRKRGLRRNHTVSVARTFLFTFLEINFYYFSRPPQDNGIFRGFVGSDRAPKQQTLDGGSSGQSPWKRF